MVLRVLAYDDGAGGQGYYGREIDDAAVLSMSGCFTRSPKS